MAVINNNRKLAVKKIIISVVLVILASAGALVIWALKLERYYFGPRTFPVVLVSDIHMGSQKCEWDQCGPEIETAFRYVLENTGDALMVTAGDNTDASAYADDQTAASALREQYKNRLLELVGGRKILWANGNHDRQTYVGGEEYFSYDQNNWRFIVIRTPDVEGTQYDWLVEQLKTDKKKIVVMHHPVFKQGKRDVLERYQKLVDLFGEQGVKYVVSGHWHADKFEREVDGVVYKALRGLTYNYQQNQEAKFETINLDYRKIDVEVLTPRKAQFVNWVHQLLEK